MLSLVTYEIRKIAEKVRRKTSGTSCIKLNDGRNCQRQTLKY